MVRAARRGALGRTRPTRSARPTCHVDRSFKSLQNIVTILFALERFDEVVPKYEQMLGLMGTVTRNECTDAINRCAVRRTRAVFFPLDA